MSCRCSVRVKLVGVVGMMCMDGKMEVKFSGKISRVALSRPISRSV